MSRIPPYSQCSLVKCLFLSQRTGVPLTPVRLQFRRTWVPQTLVGPEVPPGNKAKKIGHQDGTTPFGYELAVGIRGLRYGSFGRPAGV